MVVRSPAPPSVPPDSLIAGASIVRGLFTLTVAPDRPSVPLPENDTPVFRLRVPPAKSRVLPAATAYKPLSAPPPSSLSVPASTFTMPLLLKPMAMAVLTSLPDFR